MRPREAAAAETATLFFLFNQKIKKIRRRSKPLIHQIYGILIFKAIHCLLF